jgi:hypothetical protein
MTVGRRLSLPVVLLLGAVLAAPAEATLLVRSDGSGLFVMDKNGLNDNVLIFGGTLDGRVAYTINNNNSDDIFKYDRQAGCRDVSGNPKAVRCFRNGPAINVQLSSGNDRLNMCDPHVLCSPAAPAGEASVAAGFGNDLVLGHVGRDQLHGQSGDDELKGFTGNDTLEGDDGSDRVEGGDGNDEVRGDDGADVLFGDLGADVHRGGTGDDFIGSREPDGFASVADAVDCGSGFDTVEADLKDNIQADCNDVDRAPVGETPNVDVLGKSLRVSRSGRVRVRMRCPRGVRSLGCKGRLQLRLDTRRAGSSRSRRVRYKIKAGKRKRVTLKLTRRDVRRLRSRQRRGRKTRGILTSVEKGRKGRKTTVRNPRLRLR